MPVGESRDILLHARPQLFHLFLRVKFIRLPVNTGIGEYGGRGRLEGYVDELYIYNRSLPEPALNALIQKCQGPKSTMVLHLSFDKKSGTKFLDDSGLLNHAVIGGPPLQPGQPTPAPPPRKCTLYISLKLTNLRARKIKYQVSWLIFLYQTPLVVRPLFRSSLLTESLEQASFKYNSPSLANKIISISSNLRI